MSTPTPTLGAGVYHRPSREFCLVRAVHRDRRSGAVLGYDLWNDYTKAELRRVPAGEVDIRHDEIGDLTWIWRDLKPGMTITWPEQPWQLDVVHIGDFDKDGGCWLDTLQGRFYVYGADRFTELTPARADLMAAVVMDESERLR